MGAGVAPNAGGNEEVDELVEILSEMAGKETIIPDLFLSVE